MSTKAASRFFVSKFFLWFLALTAASYFLFSFDYAKFLKTDGNVAKRAFESLSLPRIDLGIDLQGAERGH